MMKPAIGSTSSVHAAAVANRRKASELKRMSSARAGRVAQAVAKSAHGLNDVDGDFLAQAPDEHLDGVRIAVEILLVEMLDKLGARHHAAVVVHELGEQAVFVRGELDLLAVAGPPRRLGVEP